MGKFAAVYDIPGGEQMLVCVVHTDGQEPFFQVSTEIHGVQTSINMPVTLHDDDDERKASRLQLKDIAIATLEDMTMENLLQLRKMMVAELLKQQSIQRKATVR